MTTQINGDTGVSQVQDGTISAADFQAALFEAAKSTNGYQKLPSGLIIQWGANSNDNALGGGLSQITFPIPFPNTTLVVHAEAQVSNPAYALYSARIQYLGVTNSGAVCCWYGENNILTTDAAVGSWIAIGY